MTRNHSVGSATLLLIASLALSAGAAAQEFVRIEGAPCVTPPPLKCPDGGCVGDAAALVTEGGPVVEAETDRSYFLDYPCDLRPGEEVTFVMSLHGFGSYGNWQRHYFPLVDYKDEHRLVVATPNSPRQLWTSEDDRYLENIASFVVDEIGAENVRAFWLVGHSQGGLTSRRLVCSEYFRDRVDGFLSLSGGRVGGQAPVELNPPPIEGAGQASSGDDEPSENRGPPRMEIPPLDCDFSHIYTTGEHELVEGLASLPATSELSEKFDCSERIRRDDVVDTEGGYVYDSRRQENPTLSWGRTARPGTARIFVYPGCDDGRVVADVVRMDKGHTEGLEPRVTEALIRLMVSAEGGKVRALGS